MTRHRYLVMYDISDDKRLRRVRDVANTFGYSLQYSVFLCDLDPQELVRLRWAIGEEINHDLDAVALIDLGDVDHVAMRRFSFLGRRPSLRSTGATVI
ncbi:MAG: CRISPR-associated endonuclease Cas2 [Acidimicrobiales bacterium]